MISLSLFILFLASYILANSCFGKMLRLSDWRIERQ